jgi:hypothetical protein
LQKFSKSSLGKNFRVRAATEEDALFTSSSPDFPHLPIPLLQDLTRERHAKFHQSRLQYKPAAPAREVP